MSVPERHERAESFFSTPVLRANRYFARSRAGTAPSPGA